MSLGQKLSFLFKGLIFLHAMYEVRRNWESIGRLVKYMALKVSEHILLVLSLKSDKSA